MRLKVLGSSSSGNCYILENNTEAIILEAGVNFNKVKQALNFNISKVVAVLVTHEHNDHAGFAKNFIGSGINVYSSKGTFKAIGIENNRTIALEANKKIKIGNFTVLPFNVEHDCNEPFGYLINHPETGNILFATDTYYLKYRFKDLNNILIETNYSEKIINDNYVYHDFHPAQRDRVLKSHMSLETCKEVLKANDLSQVNNIVLIHLSDGNSHARQFKRDVEIQTGKTVYVADVGLDIDFNKTPF